MRSMLQEQLWQAGEYGITAIVFLTMLPVLLPSMVILSALFFTFLLPLLCAIGGLYFLQKHATMLYSYLTVDLCHEEKSAPSFWSADFPLLGVIRKEGDPMDVLEEVDDETASSELPEVPSAAGQQCHTVGPQVKKTAGLERQREGSIDFTGCCTESGGPESMTLDYSSLEMFRLDDESASEEESFESTSDGARESDSVSGFHGRRSFPFEGYSGFRSTASQASEASEEKAGSGAMERSRAAPRCSGDVYDSEEEMHLQQFAWLLQFWRQKEFQAGPHALGHAKLQNELRFLRKVHDEEAQLRRELEAIRRIVGVRETADRPLVSDIEELSQFLRVELPSRRDGIKQLKWARDAVEVLKTVVGRE
ncbi:hypothetical protein R1flu_008923 [Riccia fluitans]|uniref:Transmembrane protein n=1 Tax=Riccia fluitans TaxID=41844 RepID=A0ABD1Z0L7_9MARC